MVKTQKDEGADGDTQELLNPQRRATPVGPGLRLGPRMFIQHVYGLCLQAKPTKKH